VAVWVRNSEHDYLVLLHSGKSNYGLGQRQSCALTSTAPTKKGLGIILHAARPHGVDTGIWDDQSQQSWSSNHFTVLFVCEVQSNYKGRSLQHVPRSLLQPHILTLYTKVGVGQWSTPEMQHSQQSNRSNQLVQVSKYGNSCD